MNLKTLRYYSNNLTIIFLSLAIVITALVSAVNFVYFKTIVYDNKVASITGAFADKRDFETTAKEILNTNKDIVYAKLVDENGVLQQSLGTTDNLNIKEHVLDASDGSKIFLGIDKSALAFPVILPILFTSAATLLVLGLFLIILKIYYPFQKKALIRLNEALIQISNKDYSARLEIDSQLKDDVDMIKVFDSFNDMADTLAGKRSSDRLNRAESVNTVNGNIKINGNGDVKVHKSEPQDKKQPSTQSYNDPIIQEPQKPAGIPKTPSGISILKDSNNKTVVALVSKINDYERLTELYDSSELALILTDYRKSASSIVSQYGGIVETLVRDELVALFNVSDIQDKPELRAVSSGVELLHALVELNRERVKDDNMHISCKIGVYAATVPVSKESGTPGNLSLAIDPAKDICNNASEWKLLLSEGVYDSVKDHVEVTPPQNGSHTHYTVLTVEEGVLSL